MSRHPEMVCGRTGEYVVAEKIVTEEEEKVLLIGPLSSGSLHSMGTHDSSSSLDWALDAAGSKVHCAVNCCAHWAKSLVNFKPFQPARGVEPAGIYQGMMLRGHSSLHLVLRSLLSVVLTRCCEGQPADKCEPVFFVCRNKLEKW